MTPQELRMKHETIERTLEMQMSGQPAALEGSPERPFTSNFSEVERQRLVAEGITLIPYVAAIVPPERKASIRQSLEEMIRIWQQKFNENPSAEVIAYGFNHEAKHTWKQNDVIARVCPMVIDNRGRSYGRVYQTIVISIELDYGVYKDWTQAVLYWMPQWVEEEDMSTPLY